MKSWLTQKDAIAVVGHKVEELYQVPRSGFLDNFVEQVFEHHSADVIGSWSYSAK